MWAAVVEKPGQLVIKDIPKPEVTAGQFLVKVEASSICNATDNHIVEGIFDGYHDHYPQVLGHEVCGTVCELGEGVDNVRIGERVALYTPNGAFQEYVLVRADWGFARVPEGMSPEVGALCEMFDGSYTSLVAPAELTENDTVLIIGVGPLGLAATGMAALKAKQVLCVDFYENRLDMAKRFGAKYTYNRSRMSTQEVLDAIKRDVGEVDVTFMCIALDRSDDLSAFHMAIEATRRDGRIAGLNVEVQLDHHHHRMNPFHMNRKNIKYRHNLERAGDSKDFQRAYDIVGEGKIPMEEMITHKVTLEKLPWALDMTHAHLDDCIKIVVYPVMEA